MSTNIMGIDIGTSSCKACVFDPEGNLLGKGQEGYPSYYPKPGYVEQKEKDILDAVFSACKEAVIDSALDRGEIAAVSFSTMVSTLTYVDENNRCIDGKMLGWQDTRGAEPDILMELMNQVTEEEFYEVTGHPMNPLMAVVARNLWVRKYLPDSFNRAVHVCSIQDWILREFGADGYYIDEPDAVRLGLANSKTMEWDEKMIHAAGLRMDQMSKIIHEPGKVVGKVNAKIAAKTGLREGCLVCMGGHDSDCCSTGSGGVKPGIGIMTLGTLGTISYVVDKPIRRKEMDVISNKKQGVKLWSVELLSLTSASALRWFSDNLCNAKDGISNPSQPVTFRDLDDAAAKSPIGSNGVCFFPKLVDFQGAFLGLSLGSTKGDMARAVMESIGFYMKSIMGFKDELGITNDSIRLTGGVANSPVWCQMLAEILNTPICVNCQKEIGCLGAVILASVGLGEYQNIEKAAEHMVRFRKIYNPDPERAEEYENAYSTWKEYADLLDNQ